MTVVSEWTIKVCAECGRRVSGACQQHPDEWTVSVRVVPKDPERFREDVGGEAVPLGGES